MKNHPLGGWMFIAIFRKNVVFLLEKVLLFEQKGAIMKIPIFCMRARTCMTGKKNKKMEANHEQIHIP